MDINKEGSIRPDHFVEYAKQNEIDCVSAMTSRQKLPKKNKEKNKSSFRIKPFVKQLDNIVILIHLKHNSLENVQISNQGR